MISDQQKVQHLYWRMGFGPPLRSVSEFSLKEDISILFSNSKNKTPLTLHDWDPVLAKEFRNMTTEDKAAYRKQERQARIQINQDILDRFVNSKESLREKMTFFWMGHFACRIANPVFIVKYFNTINSLALGKFDVLLKAMIRNASLLQYLNNNQNRKSSPNENFARELMELFTLGIGNYTEQDVKEGARALTGWGFDRFGEFVIRKEHHDTGNKKFLGKEGNFDGDDLAGIILSKPQCAHFITKKIYKFFVNDVPDEKIVQDLSTKFFNSGYDVELLIQNIVSSEWFYSEENTGTKIKSPLELMAGMIRNFNIKFENPATPIQLQKVLGQLLFDPPNVAGWPGGRNWIDSSSLLYRMRMPEMLLQEAESIMAPKESFDNLETLKTDQASGQGKKIKTTFDDSGFAKLFNENDNIKSTTAIMNFLLQSPAQKEKIDLILKLTSEDKGRERIFKTAIYTMSLPEYQLC